MEIWPGKPFPLGATFDGTGTNFSLFSEIADAVELCLINDEGQQTCVDLPEYTALCWHGYLPSVGPGQRYGFRVHGPWDPINGHLCNPSKFLLDPYSKAIEGRVQWNEAVFPYFFRDTEGSRNDMDSLPFMPRSVVIDPYFDWGDDHFSKVPLNETIIYELHVRGFSIRNPEIPENIRGTYSALAHPVSIRYFHDLGITSIELMPIHQFIHDNYLMEKGLSNYWGYNSIGYLAPHDEYSSLHPGGGEVREFKEMVRILHREGIEVILDVVYNHTAEGNHLGPMLSMKGIDNVAYYRLTEEDQRYYMDYTGTGNSLNARHPHVLQLIMDSLRYWINEMHVDGFRFDLASTLARELYDVDKLSSFFDIIQQDPVISQVKLIAEPWDIGEGGYQVGNFPPLWSEWNGKYRDCMRDFWRGEEQMIGEFASRFTGSSDLYENSCRKPFASVNFITAHDGFTLEDLVSYNKKHNEANGEENRDGEDHNRSWNCGLEGPTEDGQVLSLRKRQKRNFLATLMLSQGIPMLLGGDELGRTQKGNNNSYCQDNEISWFDWERVDDALISFTKNLIFFRREHLVFQRKKWFQGRSKKGNELGDIGWFNSDGKRMTEDDWNTGHTRSMTIFLNGEAIPSRDSRGMPVRDDSFLILVNASNESVNLTLPEEKWGLSWSKVLDTAVDSFIDPPTEMEAGQNLMMGGKSLVVLQHRRDDVK